MKKVIFISLMASVAVLSAHAELTRLGSIRAKSLTGVGATISSVSILVEQPMMGMMAMAGLRKEIVQRFGTVDQDKPLAVVGYAELPLPDVVTFLENGLESFCAQMVQPSFAFLVPVDQTSDAFLERCGATDSVDGVFRVLGDDSLCYLWQDGYAILANTPDAVKQTAADMKTILATALGDSCLEYVIGLPLIEYMPDVFQAVQKIQENDGTFDVFGSFAEVFRSYQHKTREQALQFMKQCEQIVLGIDYDLVDGLTFDYLLKFSEDSDYSKTFDSIKPTDPKLYAAIPTNSAGFMVYGDTTLQVNYNEQYLNLLATLIPAIPDEALREQIAKAMTSSLSLCTLSEEILGYFDYDSAGRFVSVSQVKFSDVDQAMDLQGQIQDIAMALLDKYVPRQEFFVIDKAAGTQTIDFGKLIDFINETMGEDLDAESRETVLKVADVICGRRVIVRTEVLSGGRVQTVTQADGANYIVSGLAGSTAVADRVRAFMPKDREEYPTIAMVFSFNELIKHFVPSVMQAIMGGRGDARNNPFASLPDTGVGGFFVAFWSEGSMLRERVCVSVAELKGIVDLVHMIAQWESDFEYEYEDEYEDEGECEGECEGDDEESEEEDDDDGDDEPLA